MKVQIMLQHNGEFYTFTDPHTYEDLKEVQNVWMNGNNSCDCNRALYIQRYCDETFPEMDCGHSIQLVSIETVNEE